MIKPIRVLNIMGSLMCGGEETTVMNYYRHIDRTIVQFDFLITTVADKHYYEDEAISLGAGIFKRPMRTESLTGSISGLARILSNNPEIKIVHIHNFHSLAAIDALTAVLYKVPVRIIHSRSAYEAHMSKGALVIHRIFKPILRATTTNWVGVSTEAGISLFGEKAVTHRKFSILPNARDLSGFKLNIEKRHHIRNRMGINNRYVILTAGRLVPEKNYNFIIESIAAAKKANPDILLLIAGDGELESELKKTVETSGLENSIRILGHRDDIPDLLQAADLFVLPSLLEGLPGAAIEAQAAGLPCLISDTVTKECKVTDAVEFLPIDKGQEIWAERMLAYRNFERKDKYDDVRRAGYDIKDAAKRLEEFYCAQTEKADVR